MRVRKESGVFEAIQRIVFVAFLCAGPFIPTTATAGSCDLPFFESLGLPNETAFKSASPVSAPIPQDNVPSFCLTHKGQVLYILLHRLIT